MRPWILPLSLGLFACTGATGAGGKSRHPVIVVNGIEVYERFWRQTVAEVGARASFELQCPTSEMQFVLLGKTGRHPSLVGVEACGKRVTYYRVVAPYYASSWRMKVESPAFTAEPQETQPSEPTTTDTVSTRI